MKILLTSSLSDNCSLHPSGLWGAHDSLHNSFQLNFGKVACQLPKFAKFILENSQVFNSFSLLPVFGMLLLCLNFFFASSSNGSRSFIVTVLHKGMIINQVCWSWILLSTTSQSSMQGIIQRFWVRETERANVWWTPCWLIFHLKIMKAMHQLKSW